MKIGGIVLSLISLGGRTQSPPEGDVVKEIRKVSSYIPIGVTN